LRTMPGFAGRSAVAQTTGQKQSLFDGPNSTASARSSRTPKLSTARSIMRHFSGVRANAGRATAEEALATQSWPNEIDILLTREIQKLCPGNVWASRKLIFTRDHLFIAREDSIVETILLSSVVRVCSPLADYEKENSHYNRIEHAHEDEDSLHDGKDLSEHQTDFWGTSMSSLHSVGKRISSTHAPVINVPSILTLVTAPEGVGKEVKLHFKDPSNAVHVDDIDKWVRELVEILRENLEKEIKRVSAVLRKRHSYPKVAHTHIQPVPVCFS